MKNFINCTFLLLFVHVNSYSQLDSVKIEKSYTAVEMLPEFPGGEAALVKFIASNIIYPEQEKVNAVEGTVQVSFIVNKEGKVTKPKIFKSNDESKGLFSEAIRVVSLLPDWKPALQKGNAVEFELVIPIRFSLGVKDEKKKRD